MDALFKEEQRATTFLNRWRGSMAQLWNYSVSLRTLRIRLSEDGRPGNMELRCSECEFLVGPTRWARSNLVFTRVTEETGDVRYHIWDESARFALWCGGFDAAENVK